MYGLERDCTLHPTVAGRDLWWEKYSFSVLYAPFTLGFIYKAAVEGGFVTFFVVSLLPSIYSFWILIRRINVQFDALLKRVPKMFGYFRFWGSLDEIFEVNKT